LFIGKAFGVKLVFYFTHAKKQAKIRIKAKFATVLFLRKIKAFKRTKTMKHEAFIIDGIRTPIGNFGGSLSEVRPDDLATLVLKELLKRNPKIDPAAIEDVILGCANQAGEDNRNVARMALLMAGYPINV